MALQDYWDKALKKTEIVRSRVSPLLTHDATRLPYIFLAESAVNQGDTVSRKGEVVVEKPSIILPEHLPQFQGFEFEKDFAGSENFLNTFFLIRGVRFPSFRYNNKTDHLDVFEGKLSKAISHYAEELQRKEDVHTGLIVGDEDCWQFSVIIFICHQVMRQVDGDIKRLLDDYRTDKN